MKVSVKNGKPCEKILKVEVEPAQVRKEFDAFYQAIAPKAKVPGFRPGKAPQAVLAIHYKEEARKNVLEHLVQESFHDALKDQSLDPLGYPDIRDVDFSEDKLSYQAHVEIRPKIKLSKVTGLKAEKPEVSVTPQEIEESLKRIQKSLAQYKTVEDRGAVQGDIVVMDYLCKVDGHEIDKRTEDWVPIREEEYLKNFSLQLAGAKAGEEKEIRVTLPEDFGKKEFAGKEAVFSVKVKEIKMEILPPLDDELAKGAGDFKTLEELRGKIREEALAVKGRKAEAGYEKALLDELVKHNKIDLPEGVVLRRVQRLTEDALERYSHQGGFPKEKLESFKKDLEKELEPEARRQVHLAFLLDEIAHKENLTAAEEDLKGKYARVAGQVRQSPDAVEKYYAEHEDSKEALTEQIRSEKAIEFIKKHAKIK